ncbi:unnamed protein product [Lampetra planeri]
MGAPAAASSPRCHEGGALSRVIEVEDTKRPERARVRSAQTRRALVRLPPRACPSPPLRRRANDIGPRSDDSNKSLVSYENFNVQVITDSEGYMEAQKAMEEDAQIG